MRPQESSLVTVNVGRAINWAGWFSLRLMQWASMLMHKGNGLTLQLLNACILTNLQKKLKGGHFSFYRSGFHPVTKEYKVAHFLGEHQNNYSQGFHTMFWLTEDAGARLEACSSEATASATRPHLKRKQVRSSMGISFLEQRFANQESRLFC